jgi:hypothetical protein
VGAALDVTSLWRPIVVLLTRSHEAHGIDDLRISGTPAKVSRKRLTDRVFGGGRITIQEVYGSDDETRSTESALHRSSAGEGFLYWMKLVLTAETFDRDNAAAIRLGCENEAGAYQLAVQPNRT